MSYEIGMHLVVSSEDGSHWVVKDAVSIDGAWFAPITKGTQGFKRFLKATRDHKRASVIIDELRRHRADALRRKLFERDPFNNGDNGDNGDDARGGLSKFKQQRQYQKMLDALENAGKDEMVEVTLPEFMSADGTMIPATQTRMPRNEATRAEWRGVFLELNDETLTWVAERNSTLQRDRGDDSSHEDRRRKQRRRASNDVGHDDGNGGDDWDGATLRPAARSVRSTDGASDDRRTAHGSIQACAEARAAVENEDAEAALAKDEPQSEAVAKAEPTVDAQPRAFWPLFSRRAA